MLDAFLRTYRLDAPAVVTALDGWTVASVTASTIRPAVGVSSLLCLARPFAERGNPVAPMIDARSITRTWGQ